MTIKLQNTGQNIRARIPLVGSKSISNRALIINALAAQPAQLKGLASSQDTQTLIRLLNHKADNVFDVGPAGTTFRFLTAYLALQPGEQILTGSERMIQRPVGPLVEGLKAIGASIEYMGEEGYPPLRIKAWSETHKDQLSIPANISSQFISALLMIAPVLPNGLTLSLEGKIVSRPYIDMTISLMQIFGVAARWEDQSIVIPSGKYQAPKDFSIEADWSAASYHYSIAAIAESCELELMGLSLDSWQGDAVLPELMKDFGIETTAIEGGIRLVKNGTAKPLVEFNFIKCPDIAQTIAVTCAALGIQGLFSGLDTLSIKETDRIKALQDELVKVQVFFSKMPASFSKNKEQTFYHLDGKATLQAPQFATYHDHRMAMAFAPLALLGTITIEDSSVVNKSYPEFWQHLELLNISHELLEA